MQTLVLNAATAPKNLGQTGMWIRFVKEVAEATIEDRVYKLFLGVMHNRIFGETASTYGVATPEAARDDWRLAFVRRGSWNYALFRSEVTPTFTALPHVRNGAVAEIVGTDKQGDFTNELLVPYVLPIGIGMNVGIGHIEEIGVSLYGTDNNSAKVPVRLKDGRYGLVECWGKSAALWHLRDKKAQDALTHSSKMPTIRDGVGSSVWHIVVGMGDKRALIKSYFNDKSDRGDMISPQEPR